MSDADPLIDQQIDQYQVIRRIGQGGMAAVYLARDTSLERNIVLKILLPHLAENKEIRDRFNREAKATARLQHPNIVPIYSTGMAVGQQPVGSRPYIALQFIDGGSLDEYLRRLTADGQWISTIYALSIVRQIADALRVAHQADIIHRDLKPANILLRQDGTPVLSDLGIAAVQQATTRLTQTGSIIGTPTYMSPEQAKGEAIDGRSDLYALGIILFELLTAQLPFAADSPWSLIHKHIYEPPPPLAQFRPDLTADTRAIVDRCLQKEAAGRYANAAALTAALDGALAAEGANPQVSLSTWQPPDTPRVVKGPPTTKKTPRPSPTPAAAPPPVPPTPTTPAAGRRPPNWVFGAAGLILLAIAVAIWQLRPAGSAAVTTPTPARAVAAATTAGEADSDGQADLPPPATATLSASATPEPLPSFTPPPTATLVPAPTATQPAAASPYPDGLIAYSCWNGEINQVFLNTPNGRNEILLPNQPTNAIVPAFSRDGLQIAYRSNESGSWQIYVSDVDGRNRRQITSGSGNNFEAVFSPDGSQMAFVTDRHGERQLYTMNADGSNQQRLIFHGAYTDDPTWSANNIIAFESNPDGRYNIYQIPAAGGSALALISLGDSSSTPAWSYDGSQIAFESRQGTNRYLWIANSDGSGLRQITSYGPSDERPAWAPDGSALAFHSNYQQADPDNADIYVTDLTTQTLTRLTNQGDCYDPTWAVVPAGMADSLLAVSGNASQPDNSDSGSSSALDTAGGVPTTTPPAVCALAVGDTATARDNARLWSQPDVTSGLAQDLLPAGATLQVLEGPTYGRIRRDTGDAGWWWRVQTSNGDQSGWLWEARLAECTQ